MREVAVLPQSVDYVFERRLCAAAGADYFDKIVKPGMRVAIGGGSTLCDFVAALPVRNRGVDLFSTALVGRGPIIGPADRLLLVSRLWEKCGSEAGKAHYVTMLPFEKNPKRGRPLKNLLAELRKETDTFLKRSKVNEVYRGMQQVDIALVSLGPMGGDPNYRQFSPSTARLILEESGITERMLTAEGVIGEMGYSFFNKDGNSKQDWECFLSLGVDHYKKMVRDNKVVLMIAGGEYKRRPLKAALNGELFNVLVTDAGTAEELLQ